MNHIQISGRRIGQDEPVYVIAEMSANHGQNFDQAVEIIRAARRAGADAVKLQTYTADTLTIDCDAPPFRIEGGLWGGRNLYSLYQEAFTPWEWQPDLQRIAESLGMHLFSTPFDDSAVDFLEQMGVPAYKVASFEIVDIGLLKRIGRTGKPVIMSTGMGTLAEIEEAITTLLDSGAREIALLKCTSAYPAPPEEMNLSTIPHLSEAFGLPVGVSDHTLDVAVPVTAVALGACIIEKHLTLSRSDKGPDSAFSLEPVEFKSMVDAVRVAEKASGRVNYGVSPKEAENRIFRRSLFVVEDMQPGDEFTRQTVRSIRPGHGLHCRHLDQVIGQRASCAISRGTPLEWAHITPV